MSKYSRHHPGDLLPEEDYELQQSQSFNASDPLLPSYTSQYADDDGEYEQTEGRGNGISLDSGPEIGDENKPRSHFPAPTIHDRIQSQKRTRRQGSLRRALSCLCLSLIIALPSLGLLACYFGKDGINKFRSWDSLPPDVKVWLDDHIPQGYGGKVDHGDFPTNIGFAGPTPTGSEPALLVTAPSLPTYTNVHPLVAPTQKASKSFSIIQHWGNLSPFYSVSSHGLPETNSLIPETCELDQLIWLQRHGARYPTSYPEGPALLASRLKAAKGKLKGKGPLKFLTEWDYKLGAEILTPFGRSQLFNLGVSARIKYGYLLDKMKGRLPVFRTESQDRMLRSAQNFATGFFGYPADDQYNLAVTIEAAGFNNTLAPYTTCRGVGADYKHKLAEWDAVFLKDALKRLKDDIDGYDLTITDVKDMMEMCAYETVALGYSSFCDLFTQKEWKGFEYRSDLYWWYGSSFGYAPAKAMGIGWVQELVSRLTKTRITEFNTTTNSSFHDDVHFPLNDPLYVDFTHDTQFGILLPAMNLTTFAESGDLPTDHIPKHRSYIASKIMPFATNLQIQVLSCSGTKQIRLILNDAAVPLTGIQGCPENDDGLCPLDTFVSAMQTLIGEVDFAKDCALDRGAVDEAEVGDVQDGIAEEVKPAEDEVEEDDEEVE